MNASANINLFYDKMAKRKRKAVSAASEKKMKVVKVQDNATNSTIRLLFGDRAQGLLSYLSSRGYFIEGGPDQLDQMAELDRCVIVLSNETLIPKKRPHSLQVC